MNPRKYAGRIAIVMAAAVSLSYLVVAENPPKIGEPGRTKVREYKLGKAAAPEAVGIRALGEALVETYRRKSGAELAGLFTEDGEYVDSQETVIHGQAAIQQEFLEFFQTHPAAEVEIRFETIRTIAPQAAQVQGTTVFRDNSTAAPVRGRCSLVCVRQGERWRIASLRETDSDEAASHHDQIKPLEWLAGDWISEGPQSDIQFHCRWDATGNYLIRDFSMRIAGRPAVSGTQRIGYDPLSRRLKAWTFDSDGGFSEGYFHAAGSGWTLHANGVTASGEMASVTEVFQPIDGHRVSWDITDRMVAGNRLPDFGQISIVRKPPAPGGLSTAGQKQPMPR